MAAGDAVSDAMRVAGGNPASLRSASSRSAYVTGSHRTSAWTAGSAPRRPRSRAPAAGRATPRSSSAGASPLPRADPAARAAPSRPAGARPCNRRPRAVRLPVWTPRGPVPGRSGRGRRPARTCAPPRRGTPCPAPPPCVWRPPRPRAPGRSRTRGSASRPRYGRTSGSTGRRGTRPAPAAWHARQWAACGTARTRCPARIRAWGPARGRDRAPEPASRPRTRRWAGEPCGRRRRGRAARPPHVPDARHHRPDTPRSAASVCAQPVSTSCVAAVVLVNPPISAPAPVLCARRASTSRGCG